MNWYDLAVEIRTWMDASPFRTPAEAAERFALPASAPTKFFKIADAISAGLLGRGDVQRYTRTEAYDMARELNPARAGIPRLPNDPVKAAQEIAAWVAADPARQKKDAAAHWNLSPPDISNYYRLLDAPPALKKAVSKGEIGLRRAVKMIREAGESETYKPRKPRKARAAAPDPTPEERIAELQQELSLTRETLTKFQGRAKLAEERAESLQDALDAARTELDAAHEELARERAAPPVGIHIHLDREALKGLVK